MKKVFMFLGVAAFAMMLSSCGSAFLGTGVVYDGKTVPQSVTGNTISKNAKVGTSSYMSILGLVSVGDGSINAAAKNGGITKISHVDQKNYNILGVYAKFETTVYGE